MDNEELIDYEEEVPATTTGADANGAATTAADGAAAADADGNKKASITVSSRASTQSCNWRSRTSRRRVTES